MSSFADNGKIFHVRLMINNKSAVAAQNIMERPRALVTGQGNLLLQLLRQAIQEKQYYPLGAQLLEKTGIARVAFKLLPDGQVEQITLVKSAGSSSLDEAALKTIKNIAPFAPAQQYLTMPKNFVINLEYQ